MVELVEYLIAFGISASLAGASVALLHASLPGVRQLAIQSEADQIAAAAKMAAIEGRGTRVVLPLSDSSVSCENGTLRVVLGGSGYTSPVGLPCDFDLDHLDGVCTLSFSTGRDALSLEATC